MRARPVLAAFVALLALVAGGAWWLWGRAHAPEAQGLQPTEAYERFAPLPLGDSPVQPGSQEGRRAPGGRTDSAASPESDRELSRRADDGGSDGDDEVGALRTVRVVSAATGLPIEGAQVEGDWRQRTDAEGRVRTRLDMTQPDFVRWVRVSAEGFVTRHARLDPGPVEWEVSLSRGIPFELRVVDARSGGPISGANVWTRQWDDVVKDAASRFHGSTGVDGVVSISPVRPDLPVEGGVSARGYLAHPFRLEIQAPVRHEIAMGLDGVVRGRLLGFDGRPVAQAIIELDGPSMPRSQWGTHAPTDEDGRFEVAGLELGKPYFLRCSDPVATSEPFTLSEAEPELEVDLRSEGGPATVRVRVVDERGHPWSSRYVSVERWVSEEHLEFPANLRNDHLAGGQTDGEGLVEIRIPQSGAYRVVISGNAGGEVSERGIVDSLGTSEHELVLSRGLALRGRVRDYQGQPMPGLDVRYRGLNTGTDADGRFELLGLTSEPGLLYVYKSEPQGPSTPPRITQLLVPDVIPGRAIVEVVQPRPVVLRGYFADRHGTLHADWQVSTPEHARLWAESRLDEGGGTALEVATSARAWTASVRLRGRRGRPHVIPDLDPAPGSVIDVGVLGRGAGRGVGGRVWLADRTPAAGATVDLSLDGVSYGLSTSTDAEGYFQFDGVPIGAGWLEARKDGGFVSPEKGFPAAEQAVNEELVLERRSLVHGRVRPSDGIQASYETLWLYRVASSGELREGSGSRISTGGAFRQRMEPGSYRVVVTLVGRGGPLQGPIIEVQPGVDIELDLILP